MVLLLHEVAVCGWQIAIEGLASNRRRAYANSRWLTANPLPWTIHHRRLDTTDSQTLFEHN